MDILKKYFDKILILILCLVAVIFFNKYQNIVSENNTLKSQINIEEDIKNTEKRLVELKEREEQYKQLLIKQNSLIQTLDILDKKQKELNKRKKETILNEIKNFNQDDIKSALIQYDITSTIVGR